LADYNEEIKTTIVTQLEPILKNFGEITDYADKANTLLFEMRYKNDERRLKVEISKR
jgi:hypothetical protein